MLQLGLGTARLRQLSSLSRLLLFVILRFPSAGKRITNDPEASIRPSACSKCRMLPWGDKLILTTSASECSSKNPCRGRTLWGIKMRSSLCSTQGLSSSRAKAESIHRGLSAMGKRAKESEAGKPFVSKIGFIVVSLLFPDTRCRRSIER
jgi:hypothetical protein